MYEYSKCHEIDVQYTRHADGNGALVGERLEVLQVHLPATLREQVVRLDAEALRLGDNAEQPIARARDEHVLAHGAQRGKTNLESSSAAARHHHVLRSGPPPVPIAPRTRVRIRV